MADRKTMTRQTLIGEKGIELISRRCLQWVTSSILAGLITGLMVTLTWWRPTPAPC